MSKSRDDRDWAKAIGTGTAPKPAPKPAPARKVKQKPPEKQERPEKPLGARVPPELRLEIKELALRLTREALTQKKPPVTIESLTVEALRDLLRKYRTR